MPHTATDHCILSAAPRSDSAASAFAGFSGGRGNTQTRHTTAHTYDKCGCLLRRWRLPAAPTIPTAHLTLQSASAAYNDDNQLTTFNNTAVVHDAAGNMTSCPLTTNTAAAYAYDPENNRLSQTTSANTTYYTTDPHGDALPRVLVKQNPDGTKTYYIHGIGLAYEVTFSATGAESNLRYYHFDHLGSTLALTDTNQIETENFDYSESGQLLKHETLSGASINTPFQYVGQFGIQTDPNGLHHMRARYYNPLLMRFINADPIGFAGGSNWYAYAGNSPLMFVDPSGLVWKDTSGKEITNFDGRGTYISYSKDFKEQAIVQSKMFKPEVVALSETSTRGEFAKDWQNMQGNIATVMIMTHGRNQSIFLGGAPEQLTATGNGRTNVYRNDALNIQDLPDPRGELRGASLKLYSCHSMDTTPTPHGDQGALKGTGESVGQAFFNKFNFLTVIGTAGSVNYHHFWTKGTMTPWWSDNYRKPYPANGKWESLTRPLAPNPKIIIECSR